ncbi:unnamed protein product [Boreogadus saida]
MSEGGSKKKACAKGKIRDDLNTPSNTLQCKSFSAHLHGFTETISEPKRGQTLPGRERGDGRAREIKQGGRAGGGVVVGGGVHPSITSGHWPLPRGSWNANTPHGLMGVEGQAERRPRPAMPDRKTAPLPFPLRWRAGAGCGQRGEEVESCWRSTWREKGVLIAYSAPDAHAHLFSVVISQTHCPSHR